MTDEAFKRILGRERNARKEAERLLEDKSLELWNINQELEMRVSSRTRELEGALIKVKIAAQAKDDFLSNMSHEIRTPLNAIKGFVDIMSASKYNEEKFARYLSIIKASSKNLLQIVDDILDFSKIESGKFTIDKVNIDIKTRIDQTVQLFQSKALEKKIKLVLTIDEKFPSCVNVDDTRIIQIISNFLSNAIKFTNEGGTVDIKVLYDKSKNTIQVEIIDNGLGIEKESQSKIFSAFEQEDNSTSRLFGGTGLGLSISKHLISLMDGELIFSSEKNVGSVFGFVIPAEIAEIEAIDVVNESFNLSDFSGKLLVAEDNETNIILIQTLLDEFGLKYDVVLDGEEALEAVKNNNYDLVLMDNQMPKLSGIEATRLIREFNKELCIVALSANAFKEDRKLFFEAGMNDALAKPIDVEELEQIFLKYLK